MNNTRKNILIWLITLTVLSIVVFKANQQSEYELEQLKKYPGVTEGRVFKYGSNAKGQPMVWFDYNVGRVRYESFSMLRKFGESEYDSSHIGEKYKVNYSTRDPKISRINFDSRIK